MVGEGPGDLVTCDDIGRQRVDTLGVVLICPHCEQQTVSIVFLANALTSSLGTRKSIEILSWALPPVWLPSVYLMALHATRSPSLPPSIFAKHIIDTLTDARGTVRREAPIDTELVLGTSLLERVKISTTATAQH